MQAPWLRPWQHRLKGAANNHNLSTGAASDMHDARALNERAPGNLRLLVTSEVDTQLSGPGQPAKLLRWQRQQAARQTQPVKQVLQLSARTVAQLQLKPILGLQHVRHRVQQTHSPGRRPWVRAAVHIQLEGTRATQSTQV